MRAGKEPAAGPVRLALAGFVSLAVAMGIGRFVYTPILPDMMAALGLTRSQAGLIASSNFVGYLAGALLATLPMPIRRTTVAVAALAASALTTVAMALPSGLVAFLAIRFAGGVASAFVLVFASALVLEGLREARRPGLAALHFAGVGLGIATSAAVVAAISAWGGSWREEWLVTGVVSLVATALVAVLMPRRATPPTPPASAAGGVGAAPIVVAYGLFGFGYVITATFIVAIIRDAPAIARFEPWIWTLVGLSAVPSVALWSRLGGIVGPARAFALACLVEAVGVVASVATVSIGAIALAATLLGVTFVAITALGLQVARDLTSGDQRRMVAVMTAAFGLGQIVGPLYAGILYDRLGSFAPASLTAAAALVVAALLALRLTGSAKRA